jgi:hypothetical protein
VSKRTNARNQILSSAGALLPSVYVRVYNASTTTLATVFAAKTGTSTYTNPLFTDTAGRYTFWSEPGSYDIEISDTTYSRITTRSIPFDAVSADSAGIARAQLEDNFFSTAKFQDGSMGSADIGADQVTTAKLQDGGLSVPTGTVTPANMSAYPTCRVVLSGNQAITSNTDVPLAWGSASQTVDTMWSSSPYPTLLIAQRSGIYLVTLCVRWDTGEDASKTIWRNVQIQGILSQSGITLNYAKKVYTQDVNDDKEMTVTGFVRLLSGESLQATASTNIADTVESANTYMFATFLCGV